MVLFKNDGPLRKIRVGEIDNFVWKTLQPGQVIDLPERWGRENGLQPMEVLESSIGKKKVETKLLRPVQKKTNVEYREEILKVKGIGPKTAEDILSWGSREQLIRAIRNNEALPFRDDIVVKLKRKFK